MKWSLKKGLMVAITQMCAIVGLAAEPTVTDVVAKQRYPWNGLVDITCKVTGIDGTTNGLYFSMAAVDPDSDKDCKVSYLWVMQGGLKSTELEVHTNGNYRLLWDAHADLGEVLYSNMTLHVTFDGHKRVQLWEGGPYWADTNIGAEVPEDYGYYFWWGDTLGYKCVNDTWVASDGSVSGFSFNADNTPIYTKSVATLQSEGWITSDGVLAPEHDAAHVQWGGSWRMPTSQEQDDLISKCDWEWTTQNGVNGYIVRGRGDFAANSIFLPCAGGGYGTSLNFAGSEGNYWSAVPYSGSSLDAWGLYFDSSRHYTYYSRRRYRGQSVRPVQGFAE